MLLAFLTDVLALVLFQRGLAACGGVTASLLSTLEPITGLAVGFLVYHETLGISSVIAVLLILCSVLIVLLGSGKNEAAKGIMGKIRTFFDPLGESPVFFDLAMENTTWSMSAYRTSVQSRLEEDYAGAAEAWDELEKSVVQNLADDVKVYIDGRNVEMVIIRKMGSGM